MWEKIATFTLRFRYWVLLGMFGISTFMVYNAAHVEMAYDMQKIVPKDDQDFKKYIEFKDEFGEDGNKFIIALQTERLFERPFFNDFIKLGNQLEKVDGVVDVLSLATIYKLHRNDSLFRFDIQPVNPDIVHTDAEMDSLKALMMDQVFYKNLLYNSDSSSTLIMVSLNKFKLDSEARTGIIISVYDLCEKFGAEQKVSMHYSGLPYVRYIYSTKVKDELVFFTFLALAVTALVLLYFFRSFTNLLIPVFVVVIAVVWSMGFIHLFGFKITLLTGLIPALMIVIGIPNCIYLINKYHDEYRRHGNQAKALTRVISRVGVATILTNLTTAIGFGVFYFTQSTILKQFGLVTFFSVISIFIISLTLLPIIYSFLAPPNDRKLQHMENKVSVVFVSWVHYMVFNKKRRIYFITIAVIVASVFGLVRLKPLVYMVDDVPHSDKLYTDLIFVQNHFKGVMPFEIIIKTNIDDGIKDPVALQKIYKLQKKLESRPEFSRSLSIVDVVSFANQAWHDGNPKHYRLPNSLDLGEISTYIPDGEKGHKSMLNGLVDTKFSKARVSLLMADIGSEQMEVLTNEVSETAAEIFPKEDFDVFITGTSYIFLKGNQYLVNSLRQSLILAFILIAFIMGALFTSFKMILVSLIPNTIPLLMICGLMGFLEVPLKPSTILVFSIAFGIAVDDTIHFLTKFRHEMKRTGLPVKQVLSITLMEMGQSLIYTSVVLFFGFMIFGFSHFQGTVALGLLTGTCLLVALFSNLFVLPALILSFEKTLNPKVELEDALIEVDEEN